ncbi:Inner membrane protein YphA [Paraburkholderia ultramafica]|uniref:Inner membrane protein YphA n=1 Tax=Paraburkholderia ultramafica TaxID=1544867 RepID=A0A6S7CDY6_9BURK|nr:Inner membrane protein YphA [Paraburkholderia ultramafica]
MRYTLIENQKDAVILAARVLLMVLFVMFGWSKLTGFSGTVAYMTSSGAPAPELSTIIAVVMEFVVGIALLVVFIRGRWLCCSRCIP